jgi:hypothetical protein
MFRLSAGLRNETVAASIVEMAPNAATPSGGMKDSKAAAVVHAKKPNRKENYFNVVNALSKINHFVR